MTSSRRRSRSSSEIRWRHVVLAVLVVAGAGAGAWWSLDPGGIREPIRVLAAARSAIMGGATPEATARAVQTAPPAEADPGLVQVCGLGWVEKSLETGAVDRRVLAQIPGLEAAGEALIGRMQQSPDEFMQAAALVIEAAASGTGSAALLHDEVARLASTTSDPRVYTIAFHACAKTPSDGNCALLSAAQWARIDAANGQPWLFVLGDAAARDDRPMIAEALYRIGNAARIDGRFHALAGAVVAQAQAGDVDLMAAQLLAMEAVGIASAWTVPLQALTQACGGVALADANRRQICESVATALAERSDSMLMTQIGAAIGAQLAWPVERIAAVRALQLALAERWSAIPDYQPSSFESYSCAGASHVLILFGRLAEVGEPEATRDWIAASGKGLDAFVSEARAHEARRSAAASDDAASAPARGN